MDSLSGKNIIITGASSGIGKAIAQEAARAGANVALAARSIVKLHALKEEISSFGTKATVIVCDVTKQADCENLIKQTIIDLGGIDILINNAGISMRAPFESVDISVLEEVMNVNYWGAVYCTKAALPELIKSKGSLVAVSSVTGFKGLPGRTAYASSKFAMNGLFESLRMEYMSRGLHTLIACPGFTASNIRFNALKADGTAQADTPGDESKMDNATDVALDILQAIRDRKDFMLTNKQGKLIYWMNKFFPKFVEKRIHQVISKEPNSPILK
jgi:NAD(P)-dependent dehydrogenase (short-subunit alcohol dehydrogenase family)